MLEVVPYEFEDIRNILKRKAIDEFGLVDAEYEGSNVSQLINLLAYANTINNTNLSFGLNEMFLSQASDRNNVIKHARQMGYINKRKISYQYNIKLKVLQTGNITLEKYTKFESNGNEYIYLGDSTVDVFGTYCSLKTLLNENNNNLENLYSDNAIIDIDDYVISEEGQVCRILDKTTSGEARLLLESLDNEEIPDYSSIAKSLYIWDGTRSSVNNYRNLTKVASIDTFLYDSVKQEFKIQITPELDIQFPVFTNDIHNSNIISALDNFVMQTDTINPIKYINSLVVGGLNIDPSTVIFEEYSNNIILPKNIINIREEHNDVTTDTDHLGYVSTNEDVILDSLRTVEVRVNGNTRIINKEDVIISNNDLILPAQFTDSTDTGIISSSNIVLEHSDVKIISEISVVQGENTIVITNYSEDNGIITILDESNNPDTQYEGSTFYVDYNFYENYEELIIFINYSYIYDISGMNVTLDYSYDIGADGYLDTRFFIDDLRGENLNNEYPSTENAIGWDGFYASSYNVETNVLIFKVNDNHNKYCSTLIDGNIVEGEQINKVLTTPFRRNRFSPTSGNYDINGDLIDYNSFDSNLIFGSIVSTEVKDELEITVKEGSMLRWDQQTPDSISARNTAELNGWVLPSPVYLYPELIVYANEDIVDAKHFIIDKENVEDKGIELFISRVLDDGTIERDVQWFPRDYLLAETQTDSSTLSRNFVVLENENYSNYLDIYTNYANSGIELTEDFIIKCNILISKGSQGNTSSLIKPVSSDLFEAKMYIEESNTPHILHIEGVDDESTQSIKETAPLYSNTANRAVTENDYVTICNSQGFISKTRVWGGEDEFPDKKLGHIFFSIIPQSRPTGFTNIDNNYRLDKTNISSLFFPSYYQVTGKTDYTSTANKDDVNVLFNILEQYKIITLQLQYKRVTYLDYKLDVNILKYDMSKTIASTHSTVFNTIKNFFVKNVEMFESSMYKSSIIKYIDNILGDDFGCELDISVSTDLYDNLYEPDTGTFVNETLNNLVPNVNGITGALDTWKFEIYLGFKPRELFEPDIIVNNVLIETGSIKTDILIDCTTPNFLEYGDLLYLDKNVNAITSINKDGDVTYGNPISTDSTARLNIMYKKTSDSEAYKVGEYLLHIDKGVVYMKINTSLYENINDSAYIDSLDYVTEGTLEDGITENLFKVVNLSRTSFEQTKKLSLKSYTSTVSNIRNVFGRLREVNFI